MSPKVRGFIEFSRLHSVTSMDLLLHQHVGRPQLLYAVSLVLLQSIGFSVPSVANGQLVILARLHSGIFIVVSAR